MNEPNQAKGGGLWARLMSVTAEDDDETPKPVPTAEPVMEAMPDVPMAMPVFAEPETAAAVVVAEAVVVVVEELDAIPAPLPHSDSNTAEELPVMVAMPVVEVTAAEVTPPVAVAPPAAQLCMACGTPRQGSTSYCNDCGWMFTSADASSAAVSSGSSSRAAAMPATSALRLRNRYDVGPQICDRQGVLRFRGVDSSTGKQIVVVAETLAPAADLDTPVAAIVVEDDIMPGFDDVLIATPIADGPGSWPSIAWEKDVLENAKSLHLPKVIDQFTENGKDYLILEAPIGESLWDAWDNPDGDAKTRYGWLQQLATAAISLHAAGAMFEGMHPGLVVVEPNGVPRVIDLADLLPTSLPLNAPVKATLYTAPELILGPGDADARSELYSFGAMLYSLEYLHHPLEEKDFERQFAPLQITERFPDVHPLFLRIINKTFTRDLYSRFPTDEMTKTDPTGFNELIKTLAQCGRAFDDVRLDIAAWTTTGMVRTGNEDALTVLHGVDTRQDDLGEYAMVLLADGMGGYEAGEIAAAMAMNKLREYLLQQPIFAGLVGKETPKDPFDPKKVQEIMRDALKFANKEVFTASRIPGKGKRGMGCTAEAVYVDSRNVIVGHVGDSRVYHLHRGRLIQMTRDQTLVNRLVELGQLTEAEAEDHPRKNELQQAIGGQPDVMPGTYAGKLMRGDWVLVCSDGLTNHISNKELEKMLTREAANSAEEAARRLLNLVNLRGATDNATIVVIRAS